MQSKKSQEKIYSQGCGQIWESFFPKSNITKQECYTNNCDYVYRLARIDSCFRYGSIKDINQMVLYNVGNYGTQNCAT